MESRENQMFEMFEELRDYSQEPPSSVYTGIRKRMWWSSFMHFSAATLNVYYVGAILAAGLAAVIFTMPQEQVAMDSAKDRAVKEIEITRQLQTISTDEEESVQQNEPTNFQQSANSTSTSVTSESESRQNEMPTGEEQLITAPMKEDVVNETVEEPEAIEESATEEMHQVEAKNAAPLPAIPYDQAVFSIHDDLMEQIKNPNNKTITLTINEKRKVEEEK